MAKPFAKPIYNGKRWRECRAYIINKYDGLCAECGEIGTEVHHITWLTPDNVNDPAIVYGEDNLILLCSECHKQKHRKKNAPKRPDIVFDSDGNIIHVKTVCG